MSSWKIHREFLLNLKSIIPTGPQVARVLSRFPKLQKFFTQNSLTIKDEKGNTIY